MPDHRKKSHKKPGKRGGRRTRSSTNQLVAMQERVPTIRRPFIAVDSLDLIDMHNQSKTFPSQMMRDAIKEEFLHRGIRGV